MSTTKQKIAIKKIVENCGNVSKAMREAGYSPKSAKNPKVLTTSKGYKEEAAEFLENLRKEKEAALKAMTAKRKKAGYSELTKAVNDFTKLEELLGGRATERVDGMGALLDSLEEK